MRRTSPIRLGLLLFTLLAACGDDDGTPPDAGNDADGSDARVDSSTPCASAAECSNSLYCDGEETCAPGTVGADARGCIAGTPVACDLGETCDEATTACLACSTEDADGDGVSECDGDCDDGDPGRYPGATEVCDSDDEDCNSATFGFLDVDGDGYSSIACCNGAGETLVCGMDCDPARPGAHPDATETCNGIDDDCDGEIDEGVTRTFYPDADGDGFGDPAGATMSDCTPMAGFVEDATDCDDSVSGRNPGAPEVCDAVDNDCDGLTDEFVSGTYYLDGDHDGYGLSDVTIQACTRPANYADRPGDCDDTSAARSPALPEVCDGVDNDCDGTVDDGAASTNWYRDADGDGHGTALDSVSSCAPVAGRVLLAGDCDDADPSRNPAAPEVCDGVDNDCDTIVDEGVASVYYRDADADGFGIASDTITTCTRPAGYSMLAGDCDDATSRRSPGLPESCDGIDNDCDGAIDNGVAIPVWYRDADGDGYGRADVTIEACVRPTGYRDVAGDCDDASSSRNPAAPEVCDGIDNDCDLIVDDGVLQTFYRDADGDGYGTMVIATPGATTQACAQPSGYAAASTDCDDTRASRNPGAPEVCDGVDNDCNGLLDYPGEDSDGDGHTIAACGGDDCDNGRADVHPGAPELCDGRDNDCDGVLGLAEDADRDGRASIACGGGDCDDGNAAVYAGAPERCDGLDNNCNGAFDGPGEDVDGDRYVALACGGTDCNDLNPAIHPGVPELCDAVDDNCDGALLPSEDDDHDGYADVTCGGTDCDDTNASVHPGADEGCDGLDTNCDATLGAAEDADRDGYARASCDTACVGTCGDCDDTRAEVHPGATELCDGRDDDCDGALDGPNEDDDRDGYADVACGGACTATCTDCDDTRDFIHPNPPPRDCDGFDNDCDGITDEVESPYGIAYPELGAADMANRIVVNGGTATLVATDVTGGSRNIVLAQFSATDLHLLAPRRFLTTGIADEDQARIAVAGTGYVIVFLSNVSGVNAVHWARLDSAGTMIAGPIAITDGTAASTPSIAVGGAAMDRALVVFAQDGIARRMVIDNATGAILAPTANLGAAVAADTDTAFDPTSDHFGALVSDGSYPTANLTLHRVDEAGAVVGSDEVGTTYYRVNYGHVLPGDGRFFVVRLGSSGMAIRAWSTTSGAVSTETSVPAPIGGLSFGEEAGISPTNVWVAWNGAISVRHRSDLSPYTGVFASGMVSYDPGGMVWADGLMIGSTTHNGSYAVVSAATCR